MAKFAISVPIGSWHPFLPACLASLRAQGDHVSVAFLDASGDPRVREIADQNDDWLSYRRHGPDAGQSDAILEGWANLSGDWLGWLNADDILMPGTLDQVVAHLARDPELDVIYGHSTILDDRGAMTGYHFNVEPPGPKLLEAGIISQPSCFFSRMAYERVGGLNRDLHYVMDWDLWIRLYKGDAKFGFIDAPLSMVLWGADTKTASLNKRRRAELKAIIAEHAPDHHQTTTFRAFIVHGCADRIWPPALKAKVLHRLRRNGPKVFGLGASGAVGQDGVTLHLAHYEAHDQTGLLLELAGDTQKLKISATPGVAAIRHRDGGVEIGFETPLGANVPCRVDINPAAEGLIFKRAAWLTEK